MQIYEKKRKTLFLRILSAVLIIKNIFKRKTILIIYMNQEAIVQKNYEFLLHILPQLSKFPRNQQFLLTDMMQTKLMDLQDAYIKAYYAVRKEKGEILRECNFGLEQLRYLARLLHDLKYFETELI